MSKYETAADKIIKKYNEGYAKVARNNGFTVRHEGYRETGPFSGGTFGRMTHVFSAGGVPDIYAQTDVLVFTAHGLARSVLVEPMKCHTGALVDRPVPSTMYVKEIRDARARRQ